MVSGKIIDVKISHRLGEMNLPSHFRIQLQEMVVCMRQAIHNGGSQ